MGPVCMTIMHVQALVAADSQLWDRAMSEAPNSARGSAPPLEDRDDEWLLVIAEPRATNLLAVASIVHEFIAGALFVPALDSAELLPSSSAISWAHKNWLYQVNFSKFCAIFLANIFQSDSY